MSGLLNELESYDEVHRAIAAGEPRSWFEDERLRKRKAVMAEEKRAKLNDLIEAKKEELAPYDRAGITSKYTDDKASRLRKELEVLRARLGKACKVPPLRRK